MDIHSLLSELGRQLGTELRWDSHGVCRLVFDGRTTVDLEPSLDGDSLYMHSVVGPLPAADREKVLLALLDANYFGRQTGHAYLAVDRENGEISLQQRFAASDLNISAFTRDLQAFVDHLEALQSGGVDVAQNASGPSASLSDTAPMIVLRP